MDPPAPAGRGPSPLGLFLVAALLLGVAAALLTGTPPVPPAIPSSAGWTLNYGGLVVLSVVVIALVVAWVVYRFIQRLRDPSGAQYLGRAGVVFAVMFLLFIGFLVVARLLGSPGSPATGAHAGNGSAPPPPPGGGGGGTGIPSPVGPVGLSGWDGYATVLIVGIVLALVVAPFVASRLARRASPPEAIPADAAARTRAEVAAALRRLEADPAADPRALIMALYARLLTRLEPTFTEVDSMTAREVERRAVAELGLPAPAARELTGLFEEAAYSVHALGPAESTRARAALGRILDSLGPRAA